MERDWQKECEWKDLQLAKAEELLEKYAGFVRNRYKTQIKCVLLDEKAEMPIRAHEWDAGADCKAISVTYINDKGDVVDSLKDAIQVQYDLGIGIEVPKGFMLMAVPKSSVFKKRMILSNCVGVIDTGYQGRIKAIFNINKHSIPYHEGDAVCQIILVPIFICEFYQGVFEEETDRGEGGYGSTGNLFQKSVED